MYGRATLLAVLVVVSVAATGFGVDVTADRPDPVPFEETAAMGATAATETWMTRTSLTVPRAEVFYSQYRYGVGIYRVPQLVAELDREGRRHQFGVPVAVYVSDYTGLDPWLRADGLLAAPRNRTPGWVAVEEAHFVVGSRARTPGGEAVVPFSDRAAARAFADEYGGEVVRWDAVRSRSFDAGAPGRERYRESVARRHAWADDAVASAGRLLDRPVSIVVGEDAPSLSAAVARAPPNTTVEIPAGTYTVGTVAVEKPITLRGAGNETTLVGNDNGSVLRAFSPRVAVADLRIEGVGGNFSPGGDVNESEWDAPVQRGYGFGPAGVELAEANASLVEDVAIRTPANGVVVRRSDGVVVDGTRVVGNETWWKGFMGVMVMESRVVVQRSTFVGGRDGVYTHRGEGTVVRNCTMRELRFGVHEMYTSGTLLANNTVRDASIGLVVMTRPSDNLVVGNDVHDSGVGVRVSGSASYVAGNVVANNTHGLDVVSRRSLWTHNVVVGNDVGASAETLLPTNTLVGNDFVANGRHALASLGPLRVWGGDGAGNYWSGAPGYDRDGDGTLDRPYRATGPVDGVAHRTGGAALLAVSPGVTLWRSLSAVAPGLRSTGVADYAPRARPVRPDVVASVAESTAGVGNVTGEVTP
jgi:nitrous oxidase accessory protein NosD/nitrous oxide reductase accessory protein NosL